MGTFVSDSMTGTDGTNLQSHTGEVGATWAKYPGYTADAPLFGNRLRGTASASFGVYYASGVPVDANYDTSATLFVVTDLADESWAIMARADQTVGAGSDTYYYAGYVQASGNWFLAKAVAGVFTELGTFVQALSTSTGYLCELQTRGSAIKVLIDGVERISVTDSAVTAKGRAGVQVQRAADATGYHLDNFLAEHEYANEMLPCPQVQAPLKHEERVMAY